LINDIDNDNTLQLITGQWETASLLICA